MRVVIKTAVKFADCAEQNSHASFTRPFPAERSGKGSGPRD